MSFDIHTVRQEFPLLRSGAVTYLDTAATAQKPQAVLDTVETYYTEANANVHRGMHGLAEQATVAYENARATVADFLHCAPHEIIFTKNCTEAINLVARTWATANLKKGDTVVLSVLEHHSNIVPWLQMKEERGIHVEWMDMDFTNLDTLLATGTVKLVSVTGMSNVIGTHIPLHEIIEKAHVAGARTVVDAAQLAVHSPLDVQELDCDFLTFSGHKLYGPTGIGVLFGKREFLETMPPFLGGGGMVGEVRKDGFTCTDIPAKFEAGTPPIAQAVGLAAAIRWLETFDRNAVHRHEEELIAYAATQLGTIENLRILCPPNSQLSTLNSALLSFVIPRIHPHDLTDILGQKGICLRAGHHCAQPLHTELGINASTRLSVGIYNTKEDIDTAIQGIREAILTLG